MATFERSRAGRAAQERGVARLQADAGGVARDVRAVLVDDRDHAERHPDALDLETVRALPPVEDLADRVGQRGDVAQPVGHRLDAGLGEPQAVEWTGLHPGGGGGLDVECVRGEDLAAAVDEQVGGGEECRVLLRRSTRASAVAAICARRPSSDTDGGADIAAQCNRGHRAVPGKHPGNLRGQGLFGRGETVLARSRAAVGAQRPGRPGLTFSRSSPAVEALAGGLSPRRSATSSGRSVTERPPPRKSDVDPKCTERDAPGSVAVDDLVRQPLAPSVGRLGGPRPSGAPRAE